MKTLSAILLLCACTTTASAQTKIERDFEAFVRWFSGSWDNEVQTFNETFEQLPAELRHHRIHMVYEPIRAESVPGVLFVIRNYGKDGKQGDLNYMSVHHFFPDLARQAIAHEFWFSKNGDWADLAVDPNAAAKLTLDDVRFNPACTMFWTREAGQFKGATDDGACKVGEDENLLEATGLLTPSDLWRRDVVFSPDGTKLRGLDEFEKFRKARTYMCSGRHKDNADDWVMFDDVAVHNQGDFVWLGDDNLGIQIRQIIWTSGFFDNATALQVYQNGNARPTVNGHGSLNTRYIGIDHPEFVVNCERARSR